MVYPRTTQATNDMTVQRKGAVLIFDVSRYRLSNMNIITTKDVQRGTSMWAAAFPARLKRIFVVGLR